MVRDSISVRKLLSAAMVCLILVILSCEMWSGAESSVITASENGDCYETA